MRSPTPTPSGLAVVVAAAPGAPAPPLSAVERADTWIMESQAELGLGLGAIGASVPSDNLKASPDRTSCWGNRKRAGSILWYTGHTICVFSSLPVLFGFTPNPVLCALLITAVGQATTMVSRRVERGAWV